MAYPDKPTGTDIVSENVIFAQGNPNNVPMTDNEIAGGYNDKGEVETDLTSTPTSHKLNKFLFRHKKQGRGKGVFHREFTKN